MRLLLLTLLLVAFQDERKKFDELLRQLEDENIEARETAAKAMVALPGIDAWLAAEVKGATGERRARLNTIVGERRLAVEIGTYVKLGIREAYLRAHPDFTRRIQEDDPDRRLALLEELSGVMLGENDDFEDATVLEVRLPATPRELAVIADLALQKPSSRRLKCEVLAMGLYHPHAAFLAPLRRLLLDAELPVRRAAVSLLNQIGCDPTPAASEVLKLIEEADPRTVDEIIDCSRAIDWSTQLDALIAALPRISEAVREAFLQMIASEFGEHVEPRLRALLTSPDASLRELAAQYYAGRELIDLPPDLAALADDPVDAVRAAAFRVAAPLLSTERLLRATKDKAPGHRYSAICELVDRRAAEAAALVKEELAAGNGYAILWAETLEDASLLEAAALFESGQPEYRLAYVQFLRRIDRVKAVESLLKIIADENPQNLDVMLGNYVTTVGPKAIELLLAMAAEAKPEPTRMAAVSALSALRTPEARRAILGFAKDPAASVQSIAANAVAQWDGERAIESLTDFGDATTGYLGYAIAGRPYPKESEKLRELLAGGNGVLLTAAVRAYLAIGTAEARGAVGDRVKTLTLPELVEVGSELAGIDVPGLLDRARELVATAPASEREDLDHLLATLGDAEAAVRVVERSPGRLTVPSLRVLPEKERAAYLADVMSDVRLMRRSDRANVLGNLARQGFDVAIDDLVALARTDPASASSYAASELLTVDPARVRGRVRPLAASTIAAERALAARILGESGTAEDRARLKPLLADPSAEVRRAAVRAAGQLGATELAGEIAAQVTHARREVRTAAYDALRALKAGPVEKLRGVKETDFTARLSLLCARGVFGDDVSEALEAAMVDEGDTQVLDALTAMAKRGSAPAVAILRKRALLGTSLEWNAALASVGDKEAIAALKADPDLEAAAILVELGAHDDIASLLPRLTWAKREGAERLLIALNRTVDAARFEKLRTQWTPAGWIGGTAAERATALAALLGVPVQADASVTEDRDGLLVASRGAFTCLPGAVPVFEGGGITLLSFAKARDFWTQRLKR